MHLLGRLLQLLRYIRGFPLCRLIRRLLALLASSLGRRARSQPRSPIFHQRQLKGSHTPAVVLDKSVVCAMTVPSPADSPHININVRSPSGHLMAGPPAFARRDSRDGATWMPGSQTSLQEEPTLIDHDAPQAAAHAAPRSDPSTAVYAHHGSHARGSGVLAHAPHHPSPLHRAIDLAPEAPYGTPGVETSPHKVPTHSDTDGPEHYRSRTPMSSCRLSVAQASCSSQSSAERSPYREYHPPLSRSTSRRDVHNVGAPTSRLGRRTELGDVAIPDSVVAPPRTNDPNRPGELIRVDEPFKPTSADGLLRYYNRATRSPHETDFTIDAMLHQYPETLEGVPDGWTAHRHPEGALYFVHDESKTFTEVNILNQEILNNVEYFRNALLSMLRDEIETRNLSGSLETDEIQLVLEPQTEGGQVVCCYYFVNPQARYPFTFPQRVGHPSAILVGYVKHWDFYPNFCKVTQELKDEVMSIIQHAECDRLTSYRSSCPLNLDQLQRHSSLVDRIDPGKEITHKHSAIIIGRIMHIFYDSYFRNFYGEECARLNFDQTVYGWGYRPSPLMMILAPLLFMVPVNNVRSLHKVLVDGVASQEKWNMFVAKLNSQLQETSVLATVLLNANVAFLPKQSGTETSPQQFLGYMSLVASMASIILGLVFMGHSRVEERNTAFEAANFLHSFRHPVHGLERLAIIYSLPPAFLIWGMLLFSAAFVVQWFYPGDAMYRAFAGSVILAVGLMVGWCIWAARDKSSPWWFQPDQMEGEVSSGSTFAAFLSRCMRPIVRPLGMGPRSLADDDHAMEDVADA